MYTALNRRDIVLYVTSDTSLQTCRGHVDGTGALLSTIGEWLRLLAAECYSWLYKEGEREHQHVLPTHSHPEKALSYVSLIVIFNKTIILLNFGYGHAHHNLN